MDLLSVLFCLSVLLIFIGAIENLFIWDGPNDLVVTGIGEYADFDVRVVSKDNIPQIPAGYEMVSPATTIFGGLKSVPRTGDKSAPISLLLQDNNKLFRAIRVVNPLYGAGLPQSDYRIIKPINENYQIIDRGHSIRIRKSPN